MDNEKTQDLLSMLKNTDIHSYIKKIDGKYSKTLQEYFNGIIGERGLIGADVIRESTLEPNYAYQIFNGQKKKPSKERIIALCVGMKLNLEETQRALEIANAGILYSKSRRDSIIIYAIAQQFNIMSINKLLTDNGEAELDISKKN